MPALCTAGSESAALPLWLHPGASTLPDGRCAGVKNTGSRRRAAPWLLAAALGEAASEALSSWYVSRIAAAAARARALRRRSRTGPNHARSARLSGRSTCQRTQKAAHLRAHD